MKLYYLPGACSLVPHVALEWIGNPYEAVAAGREEIKKPGYLAMNPLGAVPLLIDGDLVLSQNIAILTYLDALAPQAKLFGSITVQDKAKAMKWLAFFNSDLHKAFGPLFRLPAYAEDNQPLADNIRRSAAEQILRYLAIADDHLSRHIYFGETLCVADIYLYTELRWCKLLGLDYSALRHLESFYQRVAENEGVKAVLGQQGLSA
ncbi:glutathione S-transferase [Mesocricetibacter intestinalis]|uniref:Glutathione S-transferase n=1 Tax=Mesocricetibacter intestinalis TaxID=1521930 RepID=A0A4R6V9Z5_9PAST|nr:glutathione S-transferase N-terminal domain-containing protein [Mesocricetibacter intestinalis]TDQ56386.1 glutathione S-transferase [Mesocricetibacter intestinalis]